MRIFGGIKKRKKYHYQTRNFENPFFRYKKNRRKVTNLPKNWLSKIIFIVIISLIGFIVWIFFYSNVFSVNKITVLGLSRVSSEDIESEVLRQTRKSRFLIGSQRNIFIFNEVELKTELMEKYSFNDLSINKKLFHEVILDIQEKPYAFIWNETDRYYFVDVDGYIIKEVNSLDVACDQYPLISNQSDFSKIQDNKVNIDLKYTSYAKLLFDQFKNREEYKLEKIIIDNEFNTLKVKILNGPLIYFNIDDEVEGQIEKMIILKQTKLKDDFYNKSYIDLRYGDRIYFR